MRVEVIGLDQLDGRIKAIGAKVKKAIRKGSRAGAKLVQARAKQTIPAGSGATRKAVKVRTLPRSRKWVGTMCSLKVAGTDVYYASFVELGAKHIEARRHVKQAAQEVATQAGQAVVDAIIAELK